MSHGAPFKRLWCFRRGLQAVSLATAHRMPQTVAPQKTPRRQERPVRLPARSPAIVRRLPQPTKSRSSPPAGTKIPPSPPRPAIRRRRGMPTPLRLPSQTRKNRNHPPRRKQARQATPELRRISAVLMPPANRVQTAQASPKAIRPKKIRVSLPQAAQPAAQAEAQNLTPRDKAPRSSPPISLPIVTRGAANVRTSRPPTLRHREPAVAKHGALQTEKKLKKLTPTSCRRKGK
jgi:hypothetical protein